VATEDAVSDEKQYTERDLILAKREAYVDGRHESLTAARPTPSERAAYVRDAERRYPLPKVTRARVIRRNVGHFGFDWRLVKNTLEYANPGKEDWEPYVPEKGEWADVAAILNDLLANPTEEVDA